MYRSPDFGSRRIYYNNFASHLLNAYSPNMLYPELPYTWSDADWQKLIDMIAGFGFNVWEFWLVPRLFSQEGLSSDFGKDFIRQVNTIIDYAHGRGIQVEMLCGLATTGSAWHTLCPNVQEEWAHIKALWSAWTRILPDLDIVGIFPGDPGACSRNGCTALTYIDKSIEIAELIKTEPAKKRNRISHMGTAVFGWGNLEGPDRIGVENLCRHTSILPGNSTASVRIAVWNIYSKDCRISRIPHPSPSIWASIQTAIRQVIKMPAMVHRDRANASRSQLGFQLN